MAAHLVVSVLSNKYAHLLGELASVERMVEEAVGVEAIDEATKESDARSKEIGEQLAAIETVIWLFDPEFDPSSIRAIRPHYKLLPYGVVAKSVYATLRDASGPLTPREIAKSVVAISYPSSVDEKTLSKVEVAVYNLLGSHKDKAGARQIHLVSRKPDRWSLSPVDGFSD